MDFDSQKRTILEGLSNNRDKSPKGSIDKAIAQLVLFINSLEDYVTTSSCSGRHSLFCSPLTAVQEVSSNRDHVAASTKGSGRWLLVEHGCLTVADLNKALNGISVIVH